MAQVLVSQIDGYWAGSGGEFNVAPVVGGGYGSQVLVAGGYETFCLNRDINITIPGLYNYILNADGSYPINQKLSKGTAWLYSHFATGTLPGYRYAGIGTGERSTDAQVLQLALWTLEGTYGYLDPSVNPFLVQVANAFGGGVAGLAAAAADNTPGDYNVAALDLRDSTGAFVQPVLALLPPRCTVISISCPPNIILCSGDTVPAPSTSLTAVDSCGNAVAVIFIDDVVAEGCPTVITRTYAAVNATSVQTCAQTITINCKPPCAITGNLSPAGDTSGNILTGPAGNYTYAWSIASGAGFTINGSTTSQSVSYTVPSSGSATFQLIVTDKVTGCQRICTVNVSVGGSSGITPGYWGNKNGLALITSADFTALNNECLRNAAGANVDFSGSLDQKKATFDVWLQNRTAVNMSYQLSAHLAAFTLNVRHGFYCGNSGAYTVAGQPGTFSGNGLITYANSLLCADGYTPDGDAHRAAQEAVKNTLANLNNNGTKTVKVCP